MDAVKLREERIALLVEVILENLAECYTWQPSDARIGSAFFYDSPSDGCKRTWSGREGDA